MTEPDPEVSEKAAWTAVALFLLVSLDLLTSLSAAAVVGVDREVNPLMAWLLSGSFAVLVGVHLAVLVVAGTLFYGLAELVRTTPPRYRRPFQVVIEAFLGLLVAAGLFLLANNVAVVVRGSSLV